MSNVGPGGAPAPAAPDAAAAAAAAAAAGTPPAAGAPEPGAPAPGAPAPDAGGTILDGAGAPAPDADAAAALEAAGSPEAYEAFTLPEGMEMDTDKLTEFSALAKETNMTQAAAQKIVTYEAERIQQAADQQMKDWTDQNDEWRAAVKSDKELGGPAYDESVANAKKFLGAFSTPALMQALTDTGMGNHPEFIRAFSRAGKAMGEDKIVGGGATTPAPKSAAELIYPKHVDLQKK